MGKQWLANLESQEKESTGIKNLKVGYNKVFGYYIEVSKTNVDKVPYRYQRKQTLTTFISIPSILSLIKGFT